MEKKLDLKEIEHKVKNPIYNDGFFEIFIGITIISVVVLLRVSNPISLFTIIPKIIPILLPVIIGGIIYYVGTRFITEPRIGIVKQRLKYESISSRLLKSLLIMIPFLLFRFVAIKFHDSLGDWFFPLLWSVALLILFCILAYTSHKKKFYIYGFIFSISILCYRLIQYANGSLPYNLIPFLLTSATFIIIGLSMLKRFVEKYPKQSIGAWDV